MTRVYCIVLSYDCIEWLDRCLSSIASQDHPDTHVVVVDDCSPNEDQRDLISHYCDERHWSSWFRSERVGACRNLYECLSYNPPTDDNSDDWIRPQDIVVIVDGDDYLAYDGVFSYLASIYEDPEVWLTYGNYRSEPFDPECPQVEPYPPEVVASGAFRDWSRVANHPLSFRGFLAHELDADDFQDDDRAWLWGTYDDACLLPLIECAGPQHRCIEDVLYVYNSANPQSLTAQPESHERARRDTAVIQAKPRRRRMFWSDGALTLGWEDRAEVIMDYVRSHGNGWVVETGSGHGVSSERLGECDQVHRLLTIEADPANYREVCRRVLGNGKILPVFGQSQDVLRDLLAEIPPAVWWLDAHNDHWRDSPELVATPVVDELTLIFGRRTNDVILIDDARLFRDGTGYPTMEALLAHIAYLDDAEGTSHTVEVKHDIVRVVPS